MRFVHFADDTTVFASDSDINNVHAIGNRELVGVDNWLKTNRLSLKDEVTNAAKIECAHRRACKLLTDYEQ